MSYEVDHRLHSMIKKTLAAAALAVAALLAPHAPATAAADPIREISGHGLDACPRPALCLYDDHDFNGTKDGRIWVITGSVSSLQASGANDRVTSAYMNTPSGYEAWTYRDHDFGGDKMIMYFDKQVPNLNNNISLKKPDGTEFYGTLNDAISSVTFYTVG
ncbi:peptidase inhibitor family I36 protein [Streptomyces phaeochromogenes]|uniref:peptidase inhibitor family I36 protein n=2 Tax=Streptomyces phaeochromogenes TaxID=1923 RepID=UPI003715A8BF